MNKIFPPVARASGRIINNAIQIPKSSKRYLSAKFEYNPYDLHLLDSESGPPTSTEVTKEDVLGLYKTMELIRKLEKEIAALYVKKLARGFCHLYSGQEAAGAGIRCMMLPQDTAITSYRCHAWMLLMGINSHSIAAELMGLRTGCSRGKGGSMHMYGPNFFGGNAIVGAQVPVGTGIGFAHKYREDGGVCVTIFGDGAADQGQVHEAMNLAKLMSLPVLYIAENNIYSMGTPISRHSANINIYAKNDAVPGIRLDGMDVLCVRECAKFGFDYIRSGKGPLLLELMTYRYFGHSMSDPGTSYRTRDEIKNIRQTKDPISILKKKILSSELATEAELKKISKEAKAEIDEGVAEAMKDRELNVREVAFDVYCDYNGKIRMPRYDNAVEHKNAGVHKAINKV